MSLSKMSWLGLIGNFLAGQGLIKLINIIVGLVLLRILSIEEFALYTLSIAFLQITVINSDMGLSQGINTFGAKIWQDKKQMGSLYAGACHYGIRLFYPAACIVSILMILIMGDRNWPVIHIIISLLLLLVTARMQLIVNFKKSILNVNHDANSLFKVGIAESVLRLLVLPLCIMWPFAVVAIFGNMLGILASKVAILFYCRNKMDENIPVDNGKKLSLKKFIVPLIPVIIYYSVQGQISVFLLSFYGYIASIAEVGALGRLAQLVGLVMLLNGFMIQPIFSRIHLRSEFIKKTVVVLVSITVFSIGCMSIAIFLPNWLLYIIGPNYSGLEAELPIVVSTVLVVLLGGTLYTIVISRGVTYGQSWYVLIGLLGQILFLSNYGIESTYDALLLNLVPVVGYAFVQTVILGRVISRW